LYQDIILELKFSTIEAMTLSIVKAAPEKVTF
jgi:hypothetical protein